MNALGKYYHDFPRLAKESGYMFQLYRGRINWSDLDKINVQEIIDERNFQLLEQNLIHVINCNLERDYDVKILDQNFVKLFKLAQLGIDYLSYCELYLDRCVILLQEQLASYQEECELLKGEIDKKDEELKKSKKKAKIQSQKYKCNKCSKIFLNETYLESHEKRRHKNQLEDNQSKKSSYINQAQQTETENISISVFTQTIEDSTLSLGHELAFANESEALKKSEQEMKIDNLKRDLEELKIRLTLAEKTMEEKKNDEKTYPSSFTSAVIPVIHSYISPACNGHVPVISATPTILPPVSNQLPVREEVIDIHEPLRKSNKPEYEFSMYSGNIFRQASVEETPGQKCFTPERVPAEGASTVRSGSVNSNEMFGNIYEGLTDDLPHMPPQHPYVSSDNHVMDVLPKTEKEPPTNDYEKKNLPKPNPQMFLTAEKVTNDFPITALRSSPVCLDSDLKIESESPSESPEPRTSTPIKKTNEERAGQKETKWDMKTEENHERTTKYKDMPVRGVNSMDGEGKSKSLFRKIVKKKSPKIQELTVNLKNSFSQLYGSVSSVTKNNLDEQGGIPVGKTKSDIVETLHKRLRDLGVDPEWSGIPKETMKQKLNILEHNRNLLNKESRLYPYLRRKLQKHVFKKLKSNSLSSKRKTQLSTESLESDFGNASATSADNVLLGKTSEITIYDTGRDSDMEDNIIKDSKPVPLSSVTSDPPNVSSDSIEPIRSSLTSPGETKWGEEERETTDFSIFQAGKFKSSKVKAPDLENPVAKTEKPKVASVVDELETDSDFDDELFKELEREAVHYMLDKSPSKDIIASFPVKTQESLPGGSSRSAKTEGQSILKSELENKSQLMSKKKVLFAEEPEIFESTSKAGKFPLEKQKIFDLSSIVDDDDDDDWSIEGEWTVNKAH